MGFLDLMSRNSCAVSVLTLSGTKLNTVSFRDPDSVFTSRPPWVFAASLEEEAPTPGGYHFGERIVRFSIRDTVSRISPVLVANTNWRKSAHLTEA